jgi:hypothetical protein
MLLVVYSILPLLQITDWRDSLLGDEVQAFELFFDEPQLKVPIFTEKYAIYLTTAHLQ